MKLRQISFKIISMVMVFAMLFSVSATTISAVADVMDDNQSNGTDVKTEINYVSFGASNVNGFGLYGYLPEEVYENPALKDELNIYGYKITPKGSYPDLLVKYLTEKGYTVNIDQLAMSSMRAEEVRFMFDDSYIGDAYTDWRFYNVPGIGDEDSEDWFLGAGALAYEELYGEKIDPKNNPDQVDDAIAALRQVYRNDVFDADLITWDVGINNFGVYLSGRVVNKDYTETIEDLDPEVAAHYEEGKAYIIKLIEEELGTEMVEMLESIDAEHIIDSLAYCLVSYCVNYDIAMGKIFELNPDVTVVSVSIQNLMKDLVAKAPGVDVEIPLGDIVAAVINAANTYMAVLSPYAQKTLFANVSEDQHVTFFIDQLAQYNGDPTTLDRDMIDCWRAYNYGNMLADLEPFCFDENGKLNTAEKTNNQKLHDMQLVAIDSIAKYLQIAAKLNVIDFSTLVGGDYNTVSNTGMSAIADAVNNEVTKFAMSGMSFDDYKNQNKLANIEDDFWTKLAEDKGINVALMNTFAAYGVRTFIGNAFYAHPNKQGHQEITDIIISALENKTTGYHVAIENLVEYATILADFVAEYYDEIYADVYAELVAAGYVDAAVAGVDEAIAAVNAAIAEVEGLDLHANLADSKALLLEELALVADTLAEVKNLLTVADQLDAETYAELKALVDTLGQHLDNVLALAEELGDVADAQLQVVLADLEALAEDAEAALKTLADEIYNNVNTYLTETLPAEYNAFVEAVTDALRYYSAEAADYVYNWLLENPAKVIEFFAEYGDDAVDFLVDNAKAVFAVLGFVAKNYGEKLVGFVLDNAEVILTATAEWFSIHGEHVWELLVVYFDALVEYYNFDFELDFSSFEAIHESFNRVFVLLGDLVDIIAKGVYDFADALGILDEIEAELTNLNAKLSSAVRNQIDAVNGLVEDKIAALNQLFADKIDAINDFVAERIAELEAQAEAQINAVKAEIEAQIAALKAELETAVGEAKAALEAEIARLEALLEAKVAEINAQVEAQIAALNAQAEAQIAVLEAELKALVEKEIQHAEEAIAALDLLLQNGVKSLAAYICDTITNFVEDAVAGKFTPNEDTYYVSVNGGNADYADLLAEALSKNLDNPIALDKMIWGNLDYDKLALADLITIGFDENELSAFAVEQMLGYLEDYINGDIRDSVVDHADGLIAAVVNNLLETYPVYGLILGDYEKDLAQDYADGLLNGAIDALVGNGELPEELGVSAETAAVLQWLGSAINGKDAQELDWAKYVGENNLHYVDEAREALRNELTKAGVIETYVLSISLVSADVHEAVIEFLAQIIEESGLVGTSRKNLEQTLEDLRNYDNFVALFGEYATYTIELPVVDSLVFAAESYLYNNVAFQVEYGKLILDLYEINPEATVVLLGHYNPFDFELALGDLAIDLTTAYGCVSGVASLQPFVYALLSEKVAYVDIYELETKYDSYVAEGVVENNLLNFVMMYLADNTITDASEAGNVYIYEQILNYLTIGCEHRYDNACDEICNKCGEHREVAGHVYDHACDTDCNVCGATRVVGEHVYDYSCDTTCNICGATRRPGQHDFDENGVCVNCGTLRPSAHIHTFTGCDDTTCNTCDFTRPAGEHVFDNDCDDVTCYKCAYVRPYTPHTYTDCADSTCDVCGKERVSVPGHSYNNACDADCNVCGATRNVPAHVTSGCEDTDCNVCGAAVVAKGHTFGEWTVVTEATRKTNGQEVRTCSCGLREIKVIQALGGLGGGAIAGITVGSVVVAGAAGFAIFWFLIQKKSFAALIEGVKALVGGAAPAAEAEAPATEEETK